MNMEDQKEHYRHILLIYFKKGKKAVEAYRDICDVYGRDALTERTCQNWFSKFRSGNFAIKDDHRTGRPNEVDDAELKAMIEADRHVSVREVAEKLKVSHTTIENHLKRLGLVKKLDIWIPHELKETHKTKRISNCDLLLKRNANDPFLKRIVTGDEKWVVYNNVNRKRSWSAQDERAQTFSKPELHQKKVMLSIWWDFKGVVYFELLPSNQTINSDV